ncbi:unnamed protein product [Hydatigera taeniaeformis]|uniref:Fibronectin type-III domain-containing protein n=1 Tax=Hydatigena taeniaeformis TaxID=6205 RepID=A0A0R3X5N9_HYDTA|nr:unnamed protein product [Hydatigera taeniaeformis]
MTSSMKLLEPNDEISVKVAITGIPWTKEIANWLQCMEQIPPKDRNSSILIDHQYVQVPSGHDGSPMIREPDGPKYFQRIAANRIKIKPGFCGTYPLTAESKAIVLEENVNIAGTSSFPRKADNMLGLLWIPRRNYPDIIKGLTSDGACLQSDCNYIEGLQITLAPHRNYCTCYVDGLGTNLKCEILHKGALRLSCLDTEKSILKRKIAIILKEASGCESRSEITLPPCGKDRLSPQFFDSIEASPVQLKSAGGSMTCFWRPPPGASPTKYRVWINNSAEIYLLGEEDPSHLFAFIPSKDVQSDTPYSCLVEACFEVELPVPMGVQLVYERGGFLRCYWERPAKVDIPLVHYRTFLYADGRKKEIRPPTNARKTAIDFINERLEPNREYSCEIMACYQENRGRLVCSRASPKSTITSPVPPPSKPLDVKITTPEPRSIQIEWRKPAEAELPDHLLYEFVFKWIPQETEYLITFNPRKEKGGLVYLHKTDRDYQQVEASIAACSEGIEGIGGGCSEAVKVKGITWPGRPEPIKKQSVKVSNLNELIVTWETPKSPPGVMVNYTATIDNEPHNVSHSCNVKHRDFVSSLSCKVKDIPNLNEFNLTVIGCIAPNSDGNGGGCSHPSVRAYHRNMQRSPLTPSNVSAVEIGAGQLQVNFQVDEKLQANTVYFLAEAKVENRTVALCRTYLACVTHFCILEGLNSSVNYTIITRSCNEVNDPMDELCSPPSNPVFASVTISGRASDVVLICTILPKIMFTQLI